jgi:hypothetical protein
MSVNSEVLPIPGAKNKIEERKSAAKRNRRVNPITSLRILSPGGSYGIQPRQLSTPVLQRSGGF